MNWMIARLEAVWHRLHTGHKIDWWYEPDPIAGCSGDILCVKCNKLFWCRLHDPWKTNV